MKKLLPILLLIAIIAYMLLLSSCDDLFDNTSTHKHDFGEWVTTKEPTCTEDGIDTRVCSTCDEEETRFIFKADHTFGEWVTTKEPTCAEEGVKAHACSVCGKKEEQPIAKSKHNYIEIVLEEPTYTEHGYSKEVCSVCGDEQSAKYMPATGTSEGLAYTYVYSNSNEKSITITGIGSFTGTELIIPAYIEGLPVTHIYWEAFSGNQTITSLYIPDTITNMDTGIFRNCTSLSTVVLSDSLYQIAYEIFDGCTSLNFNEYQNGLYLGTKNNPYFALIDVKDEKVSSITIHEDCKIIAGGSLASLSNLTEVVIPEGLISIGDVAFAYSGKLSKINIPDSVTLLGSRSFAGCTSLESIEIGKGIDTLYYNTFDYCTSLVSVTLPDTIKELHTNVFGRCKNLKTITYLGTLEQWNKIKRSSTNSDEGFYTVICLDGEVIPNHPGEHDHAYSGKWFSSDNATMYNFCDLCGEMATIDVPECAHKINVDSMQWSEDGQYCTCTLCDVSFYTKDIFTIDITDCEDGKLCLTLSSMLPGMYIDIWICDSNYATVNILTDNFTNDVLDYNSRNLIYKVVLGENISYVDYIPFQKAEILVIGEDVAEIADHFMNDAFAIREIYIEGDLPKIGQQSFYARNVADVDYSVMPTVYYYEGAKGFEGYKYKIQGCTLRMVGEEFEPIPDIALKEYSVSAAEKSIEMAYEIFVRGAETRPYLQFIPYCALDKYKPIKDFTLTLTKGLTTDREKAEAIFNWIIENVEYDDGATYYSVDEIFEKRKAVCAGYAALLHDMLAAVDIPSLYANGINYFGTSLTVKELATEAYDLRYMYEGHSHGWSICYLDGEVVICDATWGIFDYSPEEMANNCIATLTIQDIAVTPDGFDPRHQTSEFYLYYDQGELYCLSNGYVDKVDQFGTSFNSIGSFKYMFRIANDGNEYTGDFIDNKNAYHDTFMMYGEGLQWARFACADFRIYMYRDILNYAIFQNVYYGKNIVIDRMEDFVIDNEGNIYRIMENGELAVFGTASVLDVINIPEYVEGKRVTRIDPWAFENSKIKEINLPNSIEFIGGAAFSYCYYLEHITLPAELKTIEPGAFAYCYSLKSVYIPISLEFVGVPNSNTMYLPDEIFYGIDAEQLTVYYEGTEEDFDKIRFNDPWGSEEDNYFNHAQYNHIKSYIVFLGELEE